MSQVEEAVMSRADTLRNLAFEDVRGPAFSTQFGTPEWVIVQMSVEGHSEDIGIGAALLPAKQVVRALANADWDLMPGTGRPGLTTLHLPGKADVTTYHCFGDESGIAPLILHRSFAGARPRERELCEEFRLFHNLHFDSTRDEFIKFVENGDEEVVARMKPDRVEVHRRELMEYVTAKGMVLALFVDRFRYGSIEPGLHDNEALIEDRAEADMVYSFDRSRMHSQNRNVLARLIGKLLVRGGPEWEFNPERRTERHEEFVIGVDERGDPRLHTCDPKLLGHSKRGAPYLTPVFFRREVLQKYYGDPSRYEVSDSHLRCAGFWGLRMDNNTERYVIVWLGDLGTYLPEKERPYWKSFNVRPDGAISSTHYRRALLGEWEEPVAEDHVFKDTYRQANERWQKVLGWPLFRAMSKGDEHVMSVLRVPLTDSPSEFEGQVGALAKLLVDYLNEAELARGATGLPKDAKGITKLEAFLRARRVEGATQIIDLLRGVQALRSTGVAHPKGEKYARAKKRFGVGDAPNADVFRRILAEAVGALQLLEAALK
jgi:hypothetical protein